MTQKSISLNGVEFTPREDCNYAHDYVEVARKISAGEWNGVSAFRTLILEDLFFLFYFILGIKVNHPFVVERAWELQHGPQSGVVDLWARFHYKSTLITLAWLIQKILRSKVYDKFDERVAIFSHTRSLAKAFLRVIKVTLETNDTLKACFPDELWKHPEQQAPTWSEDNGIVLPRFQVYKEATIEAWGLVDGMPTGKHFSGRVYDDIETRESVSTADQVDKLIECFDLSQNLGLTEDEGEWERIIGTPYSHLGLLAKLMREAEEGKSEYRLRIYPATVAGVRDGKPVLISQKKLDRLKKNPYLFACQQLINPTPEENKQLDPDCLIRMCRTEMPERLFKFMVVDQAGERKDRHGCKWGIHVIGVEPYRDDIGLSNIYLLDSLIKEMPLEEAIQQVIDMYLRNGTIIQLGVEKVALSTTEIHISSALRAKGVYLSTKRKNLVLLSPEGRDKDDRILTGLKWPLIHGKIHVNDAISEEVWNQLVVEMERFPLGSKDGIDALSYLYDLIKVYPFGLRPPDDTPKEPEDIWDRVKEPTTYQHGWMSA